jgi:hypothetical protein
MGDYAIRITVEVEKRDEYGIADSLNLSFADFVEADSPAAAATEFARSIPDAVEQRLAASHQ